MSLKSLSGLKIGDYTLPTSDGTNGQVLQTDGSGNVTFQTVSISDKFTSGLSFDTSTGVLTATVTNGSNVTEDLDGRYVLLGGDTMTGNLTITHANSPSLQLIDTTNDVDFRLRASNNYVTFEADRDNDAASTRMQFKVDGATQFQILPTSVQVNANSASFVRSDASGTGSFGLNITTQKQSGDTYVAGDDVGRLNFRGRDDVLTSDTVLGSVITEADNTFTSSDKKTRMKMQVYTGSSLDNVLFLDSDKSAAFYGNILISGNTAITSGRNFYGTIFYDADNTSYYVDPAGASNLNSATFAGDISTPGQINLPGDGTTSSFETLIYAHGSRAKLMKQGNAVFWQVAQGSNQFEITDAANGNSAKGNVLLRASGQDADDNKLILVPDGGSVGIDTPVPFTANSNANRLVIGSGSGNQGMTIYSGDSNSGSIYFADDLDEEGAGDSPAGNRDGVIQYSHNNSEFNFKTGGNQQALELKHTGATFASNILAGNNVYAAGNEGFVFGSSTSEGEYIKRSINDILFYSGGSERVRITSNQLILQGSSSTEGAEIKMAISTSGQTFHLDNFAGNFRIHTLASGKYMQIVGADGTGTKLYGNKIESNGFYDANSTSYYVDPASSSNMDHIQMVTGSASLKFAVGVTFNNSSYTFYNEGTSYLKGNVTTNGNITVGNDLYVPNEIYHSGDTDTFIQFPVADQFRINTGGGNRLQVQNDKILVGDDVNMQYDNISTGNSGTVVYGGFLNPASEANMVHIPHIINDLAGFNKWSNATITTSGFYKSRNGSSGSYTYGNEVTNTDGGWANAFDAHSSTAGSWYSDNGSDGVYTHGTDTPGVVELQWTNEATYSLWAGIVFGSGSFTATYVKIEAYRGGAWQTLCEITNNTDQVILRQVGSNSGTGSATTRLKYTLGGSVHNSYFRIHSLYMANYRAGDNNLNNTSTDSTRGVNFLERYKNNYAHGHFYPGANNTYDIGSSSYKWNNINAVTFNGNLVGTIHSNTTATTQSQSNNSTKVATTAYVDTAVTNLVDSAPSTLDTLNELAAALGDDANFSTTVTNSIAGKVSKSGDTMTGSLTIGSDTNEQDFIVFGNDTGEKLMWDGSESRLIINHDTDDFGVGIFTVGSASMTQPQLKVGRDQGQYWGVYTDDRNAHLVHRQDEISGIMTTRFDQWDSNTSDNTGQWQWRSGNGTGGSMTAAAVLYQDGDLTIKGDLMPITDGGGSLGGGSGINLRWNALELQSGAGIQWQNGDARIVEGLVSNYSLSLQTYDGSALSTALRLDGDNTATFAGKVFVNQGSDLTTQALQVNGFIDITDVTYTALRWYNGSTFRGGLGTDSWAHNGSDSDLTLYINGDNSFHVSTNNVKRLEIDSSGATFAGNITAAFDSNNSGNRLRIADTEGISAAVRTYSTSDGTGLILNHYYAVSGSPYMRYSDFVSNMGDAAATTMRFLTKPHNGNPTVALTINNSQNATFAGDVTANGNGSFGTSGATNNSSVKTLDGSIITKIQSQTAGDTAGILGTESNDVLRLVTNNIPALTIDASQNVGIGTTGPSAKFEVKAKGSALGSTGYFINSLFKDTGQNVGIVTAHNDTDNGVGVIAGINSLAFVTYGSDWTQALLLDTSQNATFAGNATIETGINLESGVLVIKNATGDSSGLRIFQDSSDASKIYNNYNGTLQLGVGNTTAITIDSSENTTFAGDILASADSAFDIGTNSTRFRDLYVDEIDGGNSKLLTSDASNYFRINTSGGSAQLGLFRINSGTTGGGYIGIDGANFRIYNDSFSEKFSVGISTGDVNTKGHVKIASGKYLEYATMGKLINMDVPSWNTGAQEHNLLYSGWTSSTGDYLSLKVAGNSTGGHGNLIIGDNGLWYGTMDTENPAQATDSATNPNGGSNRFRVDSSGNGTFAGSVSGTSLVAPDVYAQNLFITSSGTGAVNRIDNDTSSLYITYGGISNRALEISNSNGNATFAGSVTASSFVKSGGTSSQFLMADGSVSTGGGSADNLGNHTATQALDMDGNNITDAGTVTGTQFLAAQSGYADGYKFSRSGHDSYRLTLANSQGLRVLNETDSRTEVQFVGDGSVIFYGNVRATLFSDQDNTAYWLNPAGAHAANLAGRVDITTASDVKMRFKTPSTDSSDWNYIEFYKRDGNRASYFGINGSGDPIWAVNDGGPSIRLLDSADYVDVNATSLRAPSFLDRDSTAYYGDFGNTGTSVNVAGSINLLDNKMLLWGGNSIVKHTGSATQIGDNSSGSVLTLASGDADFTGNVEMQSGNSVGKFAVMSSAPHASFDFYNNGTSYFNGHVTIDHNLNITGSGVIKMAGTEVISAGRGISATSFNMDGNTITGIDDSGEFTDNDAHIMTSAGIHDKYSFASFNTVGGTFSYDDYSARGLYRFQGGTDGPAGGTHTTGFSVTEDSGNYGFQLVSHGSDNNSEQLYYRYKGTTFGNWQTIVTKTFGDGRYLKLSDSTVVRTSGTQNIGGSKTFTSAATFEDDVNMEGSVNMNSGSITSLANPVDSTDAVNKNYVDTNFASADTTYEFNFSTQLSANTWTDTGIDGTDMATGTYIMRVEVDDHNMGGGHYDEAYSATISWYNGGTNSTMHDEIVIHRAGHAPNNSDLQFRTLRASATDSHDLMLQVKSNVTYSAAPNQTDGKTFKFKFRKMI